MSRQNKVNPGMYTQRGRLTQDDAARELRKQRNIGSEHTWQPVQRDKQPPFMAEAGENENVDEQADDDRVTDDQAEDDQLQNDQPEAAPAPRATRAKPTAVKRPKPARKMAAKKATTATKRGKAKKAKAAKKATTAKVAKPKAKAKAAKRSTPKAKAAKRRKS